MEPITTKIHRKLARSKFIVNAAVKVRNQCDAIIRNSLSDGIGQDQNGEREIIRVLAPKLRTLVDAGANKGEWAAMICSSLPRDTKLICYEPNPQLTPSLVARFAGFPNVRVAQKGLGDTPSSLDFYVASRSDELSTFVPTESDYVSRVIKVEVATLDHEISSLGWHGIDFLKIDCEGFDLKVLRGARELLRNGHIRYLQFEYSDMWAKAGETLWAAISLLESLGFKTMLLRSRGLQRFDYDKIGEYFGYSNFVSARSADLDALISDFGVE